MSRVFTLCTLPGYLSNDCCAFNRSRIAKGISMLILLLVSMWEHSESVCRIFDIHITSLASCSLFSRPLSSVLVKETVDRNLI